MVVRLWDGVVSNGRWHGRARRLGVNVVLVESVTSTACLLVCP